MYMYMCCLFQRSAAEADPSPARLTECYTYAHIQVYKHVYMYTGTGSRTSWAGRATGPPHFAARPRTRTCIHVYVFIHLYMCIRVTIWQAVCVYTCTYVHVYVLFEAVASIRQILYTGAGLYVGFNGLYMCWWSRAEPAEWRARLTSPGPTTHLQTIKPHEQPSNPYLTRQNDHDNAVLYAMRYHI